MGHEALLCYRAQGAFFLRASGIAGGNSADGQPRSGPPLELERRCGGREETFTTIRGQSRSDISQISEEMNMMVYRRNCWYLGVCLGVLTAIGGTRLAAEEIKVRGRAVDFRVASQVLIHYKEGQADAARQKADQGGFEVLEDYQPGRFLRCRPRAGLETLVASRANQVAAAEAVQLVEPNYTLSIPRPPGPRPQGLATAARPRSAPRSSATCAPPNDSHLAKLWGMTNCRALDAWCLN